MKPSAPDWSLLLGLLASCALSPLLRADAPGEGAASKVPAASPAQQGMVSGRVFLDLNGNGLPDPGEKGVPGCIVSDEREFGRSDAEGSYQLPLPAGPAAVFVVNAPGTWPAAGWWRYLPDAATSATVDFPLRAEDQSGPLYFVQGTDPHLQANAVPMYRRYLAHVNALPVPVKFVVHTGDLVIDAAQAPMERARELFSLYEEETRALKPSLRNVMGNHDIAGLLNDQVQEGEPGFGKALYRQRFGPATYAFRHGPHHFLALDGTMIKDRELIYGLTEESANWAIRYLAEVGPEEPVILLIHEPMFPELAGVRQPDTPDIRPHEARLAAALNGKKLVMTLAGHVHSRGETTWAGAPHILGGAISYAWHGILPYPPSPRGYLLFRLVDGHRESVYLDWAEERSIDVVTPAFTGVVSGRQRISGTVADFHAEVSAIDCAIGNLRVSSKTSRRGSLATAFEATLDTKSLADGVYELSVTASARGNAWTELQPVVVANGHMAAFEAEGDARLVFRVDGSGAAEIQVTCNGHPLTVTATSAKGELCSHVPAAQLRRLNEIVIRSAPGPEKPPAVRTLTLDYGGKSYRDPRYAPSARRSLASPVVSYIDLVSRESANAGR